MQECSAHASELRRAVDEAQHSAAARLQAASAATEALLAAQRDATAQSVQDAQLRAEAAVTAATLLQVGISEGLLEKTSPTR
jgi:hypothetical protein